jgi:predicted transcriptional regulator
MKRIRTRFPYKITIREARRIKGMTQGDLARLLGVVQPVISMIENGAFIVPVRDRQKFAWALGQPVTNIEF